MADYLQRLRASVTVKLLFIGALILLLLIPMGMIESVIYERNNRDLTLTDGEPGQVLEGILA